MKRKLGVLGFGGVAKEVLLQSIRRDWPFKLYWVADSKRFVATRSGRAFKKREVHQLIEIRRKSQFKFEEQCRKKISGCVAHRFEDSSSEAAILCSLTSDSRHDWIIIDATSSKGEVAHKVALVSMGCLSYCAANKTPWATYESSKELFDQAEHTKTLLGLNCTVGAWVNEMEILPPITNALKHGSITVLKRDNSCLNFFFRKTYKGRSAAAAFSDLADKGLLEPNATDLSVEINDQIVKANIVANILGVIRGITPICKVRIKENFSGSNSASLQYIADWHRRGRQRGSYPALVTEIRIGANEELSCQVKFDELPLSHPLAHDLQGNAFSVQASPDAEFKWSFGNTKSQRRITFYTGGGNYSRTAAKLLNEAQQTTTLFSSRSRAKFSPLPILWAEARREPNAVRLEKKIASSL